MADATISIHAVKRLGLGGMRKSLSQKVGTAGQTTFKQRNEGKSTEENQDAFDYKVAEPSDMIKVANTTKDASTVRINQYRRTSSTSPK
jgi:hypothetical protein